MRYSPLSSDRSSCSHMSWAAVLAAEGEDWWADTRESEEKDVVETDSEGEWEIELEVSPLIIPGIFFKKPASNGDSCTPHVEILTLETNQSVTRPD